MSYDFVDKLPIALVLLPVAGAMCAYVFQRQAANIALFCGLIAAGFSAVIFTSHHELLGKIFTVGGWGAPLGIDIQINSLNLAFLLLVSVLLLPISIYARGYFQTSDNTSKSNFWVIWLMLYAAMNALFLSRDLFNIYVCLELISFAAIALVGIAQTEKSLLGAIQYLLVSLVGSLFFLMGVVLIYRQYGVLDISLVAALLSVDIGSMSALAFLFVGLILKGGLFPMHFWLPVAHGSALAPVSAILSGMVVKCALYLSMLVWFSFSVKLDIALSNFFAVLACAAIIGGSVQALRQERLKLLIAYSTVAQLGYLFVGFALQGVWDGVLLLALSHGVAKTAMFLAAGNLYYSLKHDQINKLARTSSFHPLTIAGFAMAGVSIMGLPPTGGFAGKWLLLESAISQSHWLIASVILIGSLLAGAYVFKVLSYAFSQIESEDKSSQSIHYSMEWVVFGLGLVALLMGLIAEPLLALIGTKINV